MIAIFRPQESRLDLEIFADSTFCPQKKRQTEIKSVCLLWLIKGLYNQVPLYSILPEEHKQIVRMLPIFGQMQFPFVYRLTRSYRAKDSKEANDRPNASGFRENQSSTLSHASFSHPSSGISPTFSTVLASLTI